MSHTETSNAGSIRKLARITGKPGYSEILRAELVRLENATRAEPGCREFVFYQALGRHDQFVLVEEFVNQTALDSHMQLAHTQHFFSLALTDSVAVTTLP